MFILILILTLIVWYYLILYWHTGGGIIVPIMEAFYTWLNQMELFNTLFSCCSGLAAIQRTKTNFGEDVWRREKRKHGGPFGRMQMRWHNFSNRSSNAAIAQFNSSRDFATSTAIAGPVHIAVSNANSTTSPFIDNDSFEGSARNDEEV